MSESEDESSDSSCDFLVPADKINLNSSFFNNKLPSKSNLKRPANKIVSSDSDEEELEDFKPGDVDNIESAQLFSQILSNLEKEKEVEYVRKEELDSGNDTKDDSKVGSSKSRGLTNEISDLLLQGESSIASTSFEKHSEEEEEENVKQETSSEYTIPKEGVVVTLPGTSIALERKKKKVDLETLLRNKLNQRVRTTQILIHKVGLLWWLVHGFLLNRMANDPETLATCLSLIKKNDYPKGRVDLIYLQRVTAWFTKTFPMVSKDEDRLLTTAALLERINERKVYNYRELVILYVALLRAIGLNCRLVLSLCPPPRKPNRDQLIPVKKEENETDVKEEEGKKIEKEKESKKSKKPEKKSSKSKSKESKKESQDESKKPILDNSPEGVKNAKIEARKKAATVLKNAKSEEKTKGKTKNKNDSTKGEVKTDKVPKDESEKVKSKTPIAKRLRDRIPMKPVAVMDSDSDEDFVPTKKKSEVIEHKITQKNRKLLSSDDETIVEKKATQDIWVEVYIESEKSWIAVSVSSSKVNCVKEIYKNAMEPVLYIVAYNSEGKVKDVTRRYCPNWMTVTRKQRIDENWWAESLRPWKEEETEISKAEDEMLLKRELEQPLPKSMTECKGHPLYALQRHLLKFEALYPPDVVPLGYLKNGEGIYSRYCVHTLRSRETWIKFARVVKPSQEPYKIVKSMPKWDKFSGTKIKGLPLELFGKWQTTPYVPPDAKDGKVPRNEYGNVYLFQMSMLPKGTVHIDLPGLSRVAKKLDIDCVPAVVGFNFSGVGSHPAFEGFVICEEYEDTLREAWEEEQVQAAKRAQEKRDKRIYGNWRKLINGLLIRVRLAAKYSADQNEESDDSDDERVALFRSKMQAKRKDKSEEETVELKKRIFKKLKLTNNEDVSKKDSTKKEAKSRKTEIEEAATTSRASKRKVTRKRIVVDDDVDDDDDFEIEEPKMETTAHSSVKTSRRNAAKKQIDDDDSEVEEKKPKKGTKSVKASKPPKRKIARKKVDDDVDDDSDFEVEEPKKETRSQRRRI